MEVQKIQQIQQPSFNLMSIGKIFSWLPRYICFDDIVAVAVVAATLSALWHLGLLWDRPDPYLYKMYERPQKLMGRTGGPTGTRNIVEKLDHTGADFVVFWGSQSGTAERFANRLSKEITQRFGKKTLAADISDYDSVSISKIPESKVTIFIVSTYGEGDPSDNLHDFWVWLESAKGKHLSNLRYMALGLGNSNYKYYNAVVEIVSDQLNQLGAQSLLPISKADDAQGQTEEHYLDFKMTVFGFLKSQMGLEERDPIYETSIKVIEDLSLKPINLHNGEPWRPKLDRKAERITSPIHSLPVTATWELFEDAKDRNCIHMELDLHEHPSLKYKTGDHIGVWATNPKPEVERLLSTLGKLSARANPISLSSDSETRLKVPTPTNLEALFNSYLEICATVPRETIASLIQFAPTPDAKHTLTRLSIDKLAYDELQNCNYLNLGRLLEHAACGEGAWKDLPLSFVIEALPAMQPRYYSISSSSIVHARQVTIAAVVSDKKMQGEAVIPGLCSNHLLGAKHSFLGKLQNSGTRINAHVRKSTFKLPASMAQPVIMVAAGSGIAPFRAFLHERERLSKMGREIGRTILFFGCRNEAQDFLYREELQRYVNMPNLNFSLITAFSRPGNGEKAYVQDRVRNHADEICDLVTNKEATLYICGSAAMARDVSKVLGDEVKARQGWDDERLRSYIDQQRKIKRWQQDVWG